MSPLFHVLQRGYQLKPGFNLQEDAWDDWGQFATMFHVWFMPEYGSVVEVGLVKVGCEGLKGGASRARGIRSPLLPGDFDQLDAGFFSLGQSVEYYEKLKLFEDDVRERYLAAMRDVAYDLGLYERYEDEDVMRVSLMRDVSPAMVRGQFHRVSHGDAMTTRYAFGFRSPDLAELAGSAPSVTFEVQPDSVPPTNIHAIIGGNGVGKTRLIASMLDSIFAGSASSGADSSASEGSGLGSRFYDLESGNPIDPLRLFANVVFIGFSAFDSLPREFTFEGEGPGRARHYYFVGLGDDARGSGTECARDGIRGALRRQFVQSLKSVLSDPSRLERWAEAMGEVCVGGNGGLARIVRLARRKGASESVGELGEEFSGLSSGHQITTLVITQLSHVVAEKSLVLFDEPETHLHPPLLAALMRALSKVMTRMNGVAIVTTHSPVVLQEVPACCVWEMRRSGGVAVVRRPGQETFGTDLNTLTREVFGLEMSRAGFNELVRQQAEAAGFDFQDALESFGGRLGNEGRAFLRAVVSGANGDF